MISICIPVYNIDVRPLVESLSAQLKGLGEPAPELIIIDDASGEAFRSRNRESCRDHHYIELKENIGRSRIRNLFLEHASFSWLLFMDGDSLVDSETYLATYLALAEEGFHQVVCGGRIYPDARPGRKYRLRWKYGLGRESRDAAHRRKEVHRSFMTNNFMLRREILEQHPFDERLSGYGHEDTLFGFQLKQADIGITHVDNPVLNGDLEANREYLAKTAEGVMNLLKILTLVDDPKAFIAEVRLLRAYAALKESRFSVPVAFLLRISHVPIRFLLSRGMVSLKLFDAYKLGVLVRQARW